MHGKCTDAADPPCDTIKGSNVAVLSPAACTIEMHCRFIIFLSTLVQGFEIDSYYDDCTGACVVAGRATKNASCCPRESCVSGNSMHIDEQFVCKCKPEYQIIESMYHGR